MKKDAIKKAAKILQAGGLVVFPTETVYGLGAVATNDTAIAHLYELKGRPLFNPLIAHVNSLSMAEKYVQMTPIARRLIDAFWPGPLTFVLKKKELCLISYLGTCRIKHFSC